MRKYQFPFLFLLLGSTFLAAQNKEILYDFNEIPQGLMLNPGMETDFQWYAGIPLLSGISGYGGSSGITVHDIFADDGVDINDKIRQKALYGMSIRDEFSASYQVELLHIGFRSKNKPQTFYSFGIYHEGDAIVYWPKDLAILGYEGNSGNIGRRFQLSHLSTRGEVLNVFHFGINKQLSKSLVIGGRAKLYSGIFDFNSTSNSGYFVTTPGQNNFLANTLVADLQYRSSGLKELIDDEADLAGKLTSRSLFGGSIGAGLDLGLTYYLNEQTVLTASILDLGFLYHNKDIQNFELQGNATVEGVEVILPDALADPNADFWEDLVEEVEGLIPFAETTDPYINFRPTKLYASLRHNWGERIPPRGPCDCDYRTTSKPRKLKYPNSIGGQLFMINRPRGPQAALTAFYQRRLGNALALKATYTVDKFTATNIGLGMNVQAGPLNFYVLADNLLGYQNLANSHYASFQLGLNIISWGGNR